MTLSHFISLELNPNIEETAFFLGNGINNYCKTTSSWKNLLIEMAINHIGNSDGYEKILDDMSVSYPEFFDLIQLCSNNNDPTFDYRSIKRNMKEGFEKWKPQNIHSVWTEKFIEINRPVLTTNYDYLLEFSSDSVVSFMKSKQYNKSRFRPIRVRKDRRGFTPYYPWHSCYSNREIKDSINEFAIWHIHGFYEYSSSIRLGLSDYMGMVEKARKWLKKSNGNPTNDRERIDKWVGRNSWLDVFLNNNLVFIGISLEVQETSLRWLLIEREKMYKRYPESRKKTWYIVNKERDKLKLGQKLFFEKLNIDIIEARNSKQIYELFPKRIRRI